MFDILHCEHPYETTGHKHKLFGCSSRKGHRKKLLPTVLGSVMKFHYSTRQWRRVGQIFEVAGGNNEFESQARSAVIEGAKRRSKLEGSGDMPGIIFFK